VNSRPMYTGGRNIAMKVPPHQWEATVHFYRDLLGLSVAREEAASIAFTFGVNQLWIDRVETVSHAELWLEVTTSDLQASADHLQAAGIVRRDEIEPLSEGFPGFWVSSPSSIIHLIVQAESSM
jgi:catechol 2,3-dioxygenase-like lactoylglutathione lyase family enzyme